MLAAGPDRFPDSDGDGEADGLGSSDIGTAVFTAPQRHRHRPDRVLYDVEVRDGATTWETNSDAADCALQVAWHDADSDGELDVDVQGIPIEPYSVRIADCD